MAVTISRSELDRMKRSIQPPQAEKSFDEEKRKRRELSDNKLKHWPNTLEALRKKKESFLKDREEALEKERQEIDLKEAEIRREQRMAAIKRANDLLYDQTDKMKNLRSQRGYCDVLHSRKFQIEYKVEQKELEKKDNCKYHEYIMQSIAKGNAEDVVKEQARQQELQLMALSREEQLLEVKERKAKIAAENHQIGVAIREAAVQRVEEEIEDAKTRQKMIAESNLRMIEANEKIKAEKELLKKQEQLAQEQREREIENTENRNLARKLLEEKRFAKKQIQRQMIIDAAVEALAKKSKDDYSLQMKQEAEYNEKEDKKIADKEEKARKEWEETVTSRTAMINAKKERRKKEAVEARELNALAVKMAKDAIAEEKQKAADAKKSVIMIKNMQLQQAVEKKKEQVNMKLSDLEEQRVITELGNSNDEKFDKICKETILQYSEKGMPIIPLMRCLEYAQPELLPAIRDPTARGKKKE